MGQDVPATYYIFLNPDGRQEMGLIAIIAAQTGVTYAHQCGGLAAVECHLQGFAIPLGGPAAAAPLQRFFRETFQGNPPITRQHSQTSGSRQWTDIQLDELAALVGAVELWKTYPSQARQEDQRAFVQLDRSRIGELTEAWIPVQTVYGPGVLVLPNSD